MVIVVKVLQVLLHELHIVLLQDYGGGENGFRNFKIDASRVVPTANENRPINTAVR